MNNTISIKEYLTTKNIEFVQRDEELITKCIFSNCDADSNRTEAHLYFNENSSQFECKKCGTKGNIFTLAKYFGDDSKSLFTEPLQANDTVHNTKFDKHLVEKCHNELPPYIRNYLNERGISNEVIEKYKLGWGRFYWNWWITIPIKDANDEYQFFKLRQDPNVGSDKRTYPKGVEAQIYDWEKLAAPEEKLIICEGELDRLALESISIPAITSTHGAMTFKQEWIEEFKDKNTKIYVCYDNDDAGKKGSLRVLDFLKNTGNELYRIRLPKEVGDGGDVTNYLVNLKANPEELFTTYATPYPEKINVADFQPLTTKELLETLGLTIKQDEENKIATLLCELSAFTDNSQFNISFNAPSSTGKSYIPTEIAKLFPEEDVKELAYCSPTAFFHDVGEWDKEMKGYIVDLSRKILIFLDQPHNDLLARLRPLLSHDKKEICIKITDKTQKAGLKTKTVLLKGYPSVIFCTAGLRIDEQEATRFLLLSPEINQEKIREAVLETIKKETDIDKYRNWLNEDPKRILLKERIRAIKMENICEIKIANPEKVQETFFGMTGKLKPRHSRDIRRIISIIKTLALLNLWWRDRQGSTITANDEDIKEAFDIWQKLSVSQELNLPPYIYKIYEDIILELWKEHKANDAEIFGSSTTRGLEKREITNKHYEVYGRLLDPNQLRHQILPMLETAGLIYLENDQMDKRKELIYPTELLHNKTKIPNNNESEGGVILENIPHDLFLLDPND